MTPGRRGAAWLFVLPPLAWLLLFFVVPLGLIVAYSLRAGSGAVAPDAPWVLSFEQFAEVLGTPAFVRPAPLLAGDPESEGKPSTEFR